MLPKAARLRNTRDFKEIFGRGRGVRDGRLFLKAAPAKPHTNRLVVGAKNTAVRIGVVVSKQVAAKATERNRIKRLLREALRNVLPFLKPGHDIILVTLPGLALLNLEDAKQKVLGIIKKSSLLKP